MTHCDKSKNGDRRPVRYDKTWKPFFLTLNEEGGQLKMFSIYKGVILDMATI